MKHCYNLVTHFKKDKLFSLISPCVSQAVPFQYWQSITFKIWRAKQKNFEWQLHMSEVGWFGVFFFFFHLIGWFWLFDFSVLGLQRVFFGLTKKGCQEFLLPVVGTFTWWAPCGLLPSCPSRSQVRLCELLALQGTSEACTSDRETSLVTAGVEERGQVSHNETRGRPRPKAQHRHGRPTPGCTALVLAYKYVVLVSSRPTPSHTASNTQMMSGSAAWARQSRTSMHTGSFKYTAFHSELVSLICHSSRTCTSQCPTSTPTYRR